MAKKLKVAELNLLKAVASASVNGGFMHTLPAEHAELVKQGLIEVNPAIADSNGALATRATAAGVAKANEGVPQTSGEGPVSTGTEAQARPTFTIEDNIAIPTVTGRGGRSGDSIYPFEKMAVGQSFFVPKESKNLASTISAANARYAEAVTNPDGTPALRKNRKGVDVPATRFTRKFVVRSVTENGVKGSRIWRQA